MPILGALIYVVGLAATVWVTRTPDIPLQEQFQGITWLAMAIGAVWALGVAFFAESKFWAAVSVGVVGTSTYAAYARYAVVPDAWIPYVVPACLTLAVVSLGALAAIVTFEATWAVRPKPIRK